MDVTSASDSEFTPQLQRLYEALIDPLTGVQRKDRRIVLKTYSDVATGESIVDWLQYHSDSSKSVAVSFAQFLLENNLLKNVSSNSNKFKETDFYKVLPLDQGLGRRLSVPLTLNLRKVESEGQNSDEPMKGWLLFKMRNSWKKYWIEIEEVTEVVSVYSQDPLFGVSKSRLIKTINLEDAIFLEKTSKGKYLIEVNDKSSKTWTLRIPDLSSDSKSKDLQSKWLKSLIASRDFAAKQRIAFKAEFEAAPEACKLCIDGDEEDSESALTSTTGGDTAEEGGDEEEEEELGAGGVAQLKFWDLKVSDLKGKESTVRQIAGNKMTVFVLLRHFGCLLCRELASQFLKVREQLEELGMQVVALGPGSPKMADAFAKENKFPGSLYTDQSRSVYKSLQCLSGTKYCFNAKALKAIRRASLTHSVGLGANLKNPDNGKKTQLGGVFVIHETLGIVSSHISRYAGDHPDMEEFLAQLNRICEENPIESWTSNTLRREWSEFQPKNPPLRPMIVAPPAFPCEFGKDGLYSPPLAIVDNIQYYQKFFVGKDHVNYVCDDSELGPLIISLENQVLDNRALIWSKQGIRRRMVPKYEYEEEGDILNFLTSKLYKRPASTFSFKKVKEESFMKILIEIEQKTFFAPNYKFGFLLAPKGKLTEDGMYETDTVSPDFKEFLEFLGTEISLNAEWTKFRGGLNRDGSTGSSSYFTEFEGAEIMFHVAPLIRMQGPEDPSRKRYVGNDIVVVIFKEGPEDTFNPEIMNSQFNHVFIVVEKVLKDGRTFYRVQLTVKPTVPPFPPYLPDPPLIEKTPENRKYFLTKMINAERASISSAKVFSQTMQRTREELLREAVETLKATPKSPGVLKAASKSSPSTPALAKSSSSSPSSSPSLQPKQ